MNEITYHRESDYLLPDLLPPEEPHKVYDIHQVNDVLIQCGQAPLVKENG